MKANRVLLIGYVGKDLSTTIQENGNKRVGIPVATHYRTKDKNEVTIFHTVWHDVGAWDKTAELAQQSIVKGSRILVEGSLEYRTYQDNVGHTRYLTQIKAHSMINLDG